MVFRFFIEGRVDGVGGWFCNPQLLNQVRIQGGAPGALPPKIGKDMISCVKWWFFTRNTPKIFAPPSARRNFLKYTPSPNLKSWIRPWLSPFGIFKFFWIHVYYLETYFLMLGTFCIQNNTSSVHLLDTSFYMLLEHFHSITLNILHWMLNIMIGYN